MSLFRTLFRACILLTLLPYGAAWGQECTGRFVNPLTDVCWECLFPISIGALGIGAAAGAPDTPNPPSPLCYCGTPIPRIGLAVGMWEPARLIDVSRAPYCFSNLGGLSIDPGVGAARGRTGSSSGDGSSGSLWHVHYYNYPLLSWIGALLDLGCMQTGGLDIAWVSELDPTWNDEELSFLLHPEAVLFTGVLAQAACAADCVAATAGLPLDGLFWCAGCQGGMYPLTGAVSAHVGGVQASLLAAERMVYRLHRLGLALGTSGQEALCGPGADADHQEDPVPLADEPARPGHGPASRVQPHRTFFGALGVAPGTARVGRELRVPPLEEKELLCLVSMPA